MKRSLKFIPFAVMVAMIVAYAAPHPVPVTGIPTPTSPIVATPSVTAFSTPTPEVRGSATSVSGGIIEVTPLGPAPARSGFFTPNRLMNVRSCPATDCAVLYQVSTRQRFFDFVNTPEGDLWLCLDPAIPCQTFIAAFLRDFPASDYGTITWDDR